MKLVSSPCCCCYYVAEQQVADLVKQQVMNLACSSCCCSFNRCGSRRTIGYGSWPTTTCEVRLFFLLSAISLNTVKNMVKAQVMSLVCALCWFYYLTKQQASVLRAPAISSNSRTGILLNGELRMSLTTIFWASSVLCVALLQSRQTAGYPYRETTGYHMHSIKQQVMSFGLFRVDATISSNERLTTSTNNRL